VSLFLSRGAHPAVAVAFGIGVPFFEIALALTDSMLRRYTVPAPVSQVVSRTDRKPSAETPARAKVATPRPTPETAPDATPATPVATPETQNTAATLPAPSVATTKTELARQLGISRATLHRRLKTGELSLNGAAAD
jgi:DNA-binding NtrC family response regulator